MPAHECVYGHIVVKINGYKMMQKTVKYFLIEIMALLAAH